MKACRKCGWAGEGVLAWKRCGDGSLQLRASCPHCGCAWGCVPQTEENAEKAGPVPPEPVKERSLFDDE